VGNYTTKLPGRIDDLGVDAAALLKQLPGVGKVELLVPVQKPTAGSIHLADFHFSFLLALDRLTESVCVECMAAKVRTVPQTLRMVSP
jgi:hypothetical protein